MKKFCSLIIVFYSLIAIANEQQPDIDKLMASFVDCDARFFSDLASYQDNLLSATKVQQIDQSQAYIAVEDRTDNDKNYHPFTVPIIYKSLKLTGYYDSALKLGKYGDYYFWGFNVDNSIDEIKTALDHLTWQEMEKDSLYTANAKIHYTDDSLDTWHDNINTIVGVKTLPSTDSVEKLLLLEKSPEMTLLVCSIQGFFPSNLLSTIRPDITQ